MIQTRWKEIILGGLLVLSSALLFWRLTNLPNLVEYPVVIISVIIGGFIWSALLVINLSLIKNLNTVVVTTVILLILLITIGRFSIGSIGAAHLLLVIIMSARYYSTNSLSNSIKPSFIRTFHPCSKYALLALIVCWAGLSLSNLMEAVRASHVVIPEKSVRQVVEIFAPLFEDNNFDQSIFSAHPNGAPPSELPLPAEQIEENKALSFFYSLSDINKAPQTIADLLNRTINNIFSSYPLITVLSLFLVVLFFARILIPLFAWLVVVVVVSLIYLMRRLHFLSLIQSTEQVERLTL
jgi:hypothetical protein